MIHVYPIGDVRQHDTEGTMCWCKPTVEWNDPATGNPLPEALVIHNSADHREAVEEAEKILNSLNR